MYKLTLCFICFLCFYDIQASKANTLDDLIEKALKNNPSIKSSDFSHQAQYHLIQPMSTWEDPQIFFEEMKDPINRNSKENQIGISQKFSFPGKLSLQKSIVESETQSVQHQSDSLKKSIIKDVKTNFYFLALALKKKHILLDQQKLIQQMQNVMQGQYITGKLMQSDLLSLQTEFAMLSEKILMVQSEIVKYNSKLSALTNQTNLNIDNIDIQKTTVPSGKITSETVFQKINNPKIQSMKQMLHASEQKLSYSNKSYLPDFEIMATFRKSDMTSGYEYNSTRLSFNIPLWAFSKQSENIRSNQALVAKNRMDLENEKLSLQSEVINSAQEIKELQDRINLYENGLLPITKQALNASKTTFQTGKLPYTRYLESLKSSIIADLNYYETLTLFEIKVAEFENLTGLKVEEL